MALNADEWPIRKEDFEDFVIRGKKLAIMLFVNVSQILDAERITVMGDFRVEGGWQGKVDVIMDTVYKKFDESDLARLGTYCFVGPL
jgi:hypothetical protein